MKTHKEVHYESIPVPPAFSSPPKVNYEAPPSELTTIPPQPDSHLYQPSLPVATPAIAPAVGSGGGNGMPACSGPQSVGYNVNTGKCTPISTTTNAIVPQTNLSKVVHLSQLPWTGSNDIAYFTFMGAVLVFSIVTAYYLTRFAYVERN